jgi:hypothetical protein
MNFDSLLVECDTGDIKRNLPLPAITGPLLGLFYFIAVPFLGFAALVYFIGQRSTQLATALWHRLVHDGRVAKHT